MFDVPHRHAVLTLPDRLRPVLKENRDLWKVVMVIANSRICGYNGREVTFWYVDRDYVKHYENHIQV
ncbi:MAG: hypothetical protein ACXQTR_06925 [Candidatus Methanospirareceae archaeon]